MLELRIANSLGREILPSVRNPDSNDLVAADHAFRIAAVCRRNPTTIIVGAIGTQSDSND